MERKVVTLCGSMRFLYKMQEIAERLELENGYTVIPPIVHVLSRDLMEDEKALLKELHKAKISISDAIFVVNVGGYIGESVKSEIQYARSLSKEVLFLENT